MDDDDDENYTSHISTSGAASDSLRHSKRQSAVTELPARNNADEEQKQGYALHELSAAHMKGYLAEIESHTSPNLLLSALQLEPFTLHSPTVQQGVGRNWSAALEMEKDWEDHSGSFLADRSLKTLLTWDLAGVNKKDLVAWKTWLRFLLCSQKMAKHLATSKHLSEWKHVMMWLQRYKEILALISKFGEDQDQPEAEG